MPPCFKKFKKVEVGFRFLNMFKGPISGYCACFKQDVTNSKDARSDIEPSKIRLHRAQFSSILP